MSFSRQEIEDLDGANQPRWATNLLLSSNKIVGVESDDFRGIEYLPRFDLDSNEITNIENGVFEELGNMEALRRTLTTVAATRDEAHRPADGDSPRHWPAGGSHHVVDCARLRLHAARDKGSARFRLDGVRR